MSNIYGGDEVNALVMDVGSHSTRAGYAGDDNPKAYFPSFAGVCKSAEADGMEVDGAATANKRKLHVGNAAINFRRDDMEIVSPYPAQEDGVSDWDIYESLCDHAIRERLRADPAEYAMMMAEPNAIPKSAREKIVELFFEKFKVPALFLAKNAALSAFATARQTALVVDAGYHGTCVTAVHDGYVLNKSITTNPVGGRVLNTLMQRAMEARAVRLLPRYAFKRIETTPGEFKIETLNFPKTHPSFHALQVEQLVADMRETLCKVNETPYDQQVHTHLPPSHYELPDGTEIAVGEDRLRVPEVWFQPGLLSGFVGFNLDSLKRPDGTGISTLSASVFDAVNKCDTDVRRDLYQGVVLTGGCSLTVGLRDRLEKELAEQGPQAGKFKVTMPATNIERKFSVWIGGSILASLGSFQQMWMSKKEYEEQGAGLIHRKAP